MAQTASRQASLPRQLTSFVGRADEMAEIAARLTDPGCRLLTLVGAGGIGKSRLAIETATRIADHFADGVYYISLETVDGGQSLLAAMADALQITLSGPLSPAQQIISLLRDQPNQIRQMLLILDTFEHLLAEATFLSTLLQQCSQIKVLVTSREVLNLQEEWIYPLSGLSTPAFDEVSDLNAYDALRLFVDRARARRANFAPVDESAHIGRICRLVDGMPLAIELAASWIRDMNCAAIAAEIERNLTFLSTRLRNIPERHRSLQAVFDQTWAMLTAAEQEIFGALSVFVNGFHWEAAQQVADASLPILTGLTDKSLLHVDAQGRYQIHNLLRQYARSCIGAGGPQEMAARDRHCTYYMNFIRTRADAIGDGRQQQAASEIALELENIRAAWQWALARHRLDDLRQASITLQSFFDFQSRFREAVETFESAIHELDRPPLDRERSLTLAAILAGFGWSAIRMGRLEAARRSFERSRQIYEETEAELPTAWGADPLPGLALVAAIQGDYDDAVALAHAAEERCLARGDNQNLQLVYYVWQTAAYAQGEYATARHYAQQAYALTKAANNRWMMAYILSELGNIARAEQDLAGARRYYVASYELKEALNHGEGMASVLIQWARTAELEEKFAEAADLYARSEAIYRQIHDQGGLANALHGLGEIAFVQGDTVRAAGYLRQALQIASEMAWVPLTLSLLVSIAELLHLRGDLARSRALLRLVAQHPAAEHQIRQRALSSLREDKHDPFPFAADDTPAELERTVAELHLMLSTLNHAESAPLPPSKVDQPLIEPLTERELDVLRHMAEGLTNQEIADLLIIAVGTVKSYTSQIYGKLGVRNRMEAVARAQEIALI